MVFNAPQCFYNALLMVFISISDAFLIGFYGFSIVSTRFLFLYYNGFCMMFTLYWYGFRMVFRCCSRDRKNIEHQTTVLKHHIKPQQMKANQSKSKQFVANHSKGNPSKAKKVTTNHSKSRQIITNQNKSKTSKQITANQS